MGWPLWDGSASGTGTVTGTIQERSSISATSAFTTSLGATTTSTISLLFDPLYNEDSSLALIAGNYVDWWEYYDGVLNITSNGVLFLQDPYTGCVVNGRVAIINASYNVYDVQFSYSSCRLDAELNGVTLRGLAFYHSESGFIYAFVNGTVGGLPYADALLWEPV